jgi:N-glycosylase/DNA lyase
MEPMIQLQELRPYVAPKYVLQAHKERKKAIRERLREFTAVPPSQWFYEFCYCLCTPQSKATSAFAVAEKLQQQRFLEQEFDPTSLLRNPEHYIRFHNTKARNLLNLRTLFPSIDAMLRSTTSALEARAYLVEHVRGMGMKEASHVLRNIGYRGIAIIDRHILTHMVQCGIIADDTFPSSQKKYLEIEAKWLHFASDIRIDPDELDLVFWSLQTGEILK